jgi:signal transduction histidine kinase
MLADGECRIDSAPGRGTTVSVRLPIPAEPTPADVSAAAANAH